MKKFTQLCEALSVIKQTKTLRYPKQIQFSEDFKRALSKEVSRFTGSEQLLNFDAKVLKALMFELAELTEGKKKKADQVSVIKSIRKPMPPPSKAIPTGKEYDRNKKDWKKQVNEGADIYSDPSQLDDYHLLGRAAGILKLLTGEDSFTYIKTTGKAISIPDSIKMQILEWVRDYDKKNSQDILSRPPSKA